MREMEPWPLEAKQPALLFVCLVPLPPGSLGGNLAEPRPRCICLERIQLEVLGKQTTSEQPEKGGLTRPSEPGGGFTRQTAR